MSMNVQVQGFNNLRGPVGAGNNDVNAVFGKILSQVMNQHRAKFVLRGRRSVIFET